MYSQEAIALRALGAFVLVGLLVAIPGPIPDPALLLAGTVTWFALDRRHVLSLKNFFLVYTLALFVVGVALLDRAPVSVYGDLLLIVVVFVASYALATHLVTRHPESRLRDRRPSDRQVAAARGTVHRVHIACLAMIGLKLLYLAFNFEHYGIVSYYRGAALIEEFQTYGEASIVGGATQIIRFFLKFTSLGLVIYYAQVCFTAARRVRYRYPVILLVILPIASLQRYDAIIGAGACLAVYACERQCRRIQSRFDSEDEGEDEDEPEPSRPQRARVTRRSILGVAAAGAVAVFAAVNIGSLRQNAFDSTTPSKPVSDADPLFLSEFSVIQAFAEIKQNSDILHHTHGRTIVPPLLLKVVPRAWFPNKPLNSGAYYMTTLRPSEFAAGFALPPTLFGDAYLSFGLAGLIGACALFGAVAARLDVGFRTAGRRILPWFVLAFASCYSLLRDPLSESLAGVLLAVIAWRAWALLLGPASSALTGRSGRASTSGQGVVARHGLPLTGRPVSPPVPEG